MQKSDVPRRRGTRKLARFVRLPPPLPRWMGMANGLVIEASIKHTCLCVHVRACKCLRARRTRARGAQCAACTRRSRTDLTVHNLGHSKMILIVALCTPCPRPAELSGPSVDPSVRYDLFHIETPRGQQFLHSERILKDCIPKRHLISNTTGNKISFFD